MQPAVNGREQALRPARDMLAAWQSRLPAAPPLSVVQQGLVNRTYAVGQPPGFALQRLATAFGEAETMRAERVAARLATAGLAAPRLVPTDDGRAGVWDAEGRFWRLCRWLPGESFTRSPSSRHIAAAGAMLARFHGALADGGSLDLPDSGFHDTARHLQAMWTALPDDPAARATAEAIGRAHAALGPLPPLPRRPGHGDAKLSNFLFAGAPPAVTAVLDLDTVGLYGLDDDLGDALRSWCNPAGEDTVSTRFDEPLFAAAMAGYLAAAPGLMAEERDGVVAGLIRIALELAARFLSDMRDCRYWRWDPAVAPSAAAHNHLRAQGQLHLAEQVLARRTALEAHIRRSQPSR